MNRLPSPSEVFPNENKPLAYFVEVISSKMLAHNKGPRKGSGLVTVEFDTAYMPSEYLPEITSIAATAGWDVYHVYSAIGGKYISSLSLYPSDVSTVKTQ